MAEQLHWRFDKDRHVKYWKRCLKTYLPSQYTSNDSNRMYLAFLIVSALDALNELDASMSAEERLGYVDWIYHCQHPLGGFRMWPGTDFGERASRDNAKWDPAHVPATYFALTTLLILGDDLSRVKRSLTLSWLVRIQRKDGSFGETIIDGQIEGSNDPRLGYCAAGSRYILHSISQAVPDVEDINITALRKSIIDSQSYDGGFADVAYNEPHAGYTFCALGALNLTEQLKDLPIPNLQAVSRWLAARQTDLIYPDQESVENHSILGTGLASAELDTRKTGFSLIAGMNGRLNKVADTCYCWWVAASLTMLQQDSLYDKTALRGYLLQYTQSPYMGGFTKFPGDRYADIYHSYMGLIALSLTSTAKERERDGIKEFDPTMCISKDVRGLLRCRH